MQYNHIQQLFINQDERGVKVLWMVATVKVQLDKKTACNGECPSPL